MCKPYPRIHFLYEVLCKIDIWRASCEPLEPLQKTRDGHTFQAHKWRALSAITEGHCSCQSSSRWVHPRETRLTHLLTCVLAQQCHSHHVHLAMVIQHFHTRPPYARSYSSHSPELCGPAGHSCALRCFSLLKEGELLLVDASSLGSPYLNLWKSGSMSAESSRQQHECIRH